MNAVAIALYVAVLILALALVAAVTIPGNVIPALVNLADLLR